MKSLGISPVFFVVVLGLGLALAVAASPGGKGKGKRAPKKPPASTTATAPIPTTKGKVDAKAPTAKESLALPGAKSNAAMIEAATAAAHEAGSTKCVACHTEDGWTPAKFEHARTGFPLKGQHLESACVNCHGGDFKVALSTSCASCHRDVHQRSFGQQCASCHEERSWRTTMNVTAHLTTNFPLIGRHGALQCTECHQDRRDRTFVQPAVECIACHRNDYERAVLTTVDHRRSSFGTNCRSCHQPARFRPAAFPIHERCYPILVGEHRGVSCAECHSSLAGTVADGSCRTENQTCRECHEHDEARSDRQHDDVEGYEWQSLKCVGCHAR